MTHHKVDYLQLGADSVRIDAATLTTIAALAAIADTHRKPDAWRKALDSATITAASRHDAAAAPAGVNLQRDLEYAFAEVEREEYAPSSSFGLFFIDSSIPEGYEYATIQRVSRAGEVEEVNGSEAVQVTATVKVSRKEERFPIRHYVTSTKYSIFQQMADGVRRGGFRQIEEELLAARDILTEHANMRNWHGNPQSGQYGVLNYPWIEKYVISTPFVAGATWDDLKNALMRLVGRPFINSAGTKRPDTLVVSPRVYDLLFSTTKTMGSSEVSVGAWFLGNNAGMTFGGQGQPNQSTGIKQILVAHELTGVGPGGTDAILAYRRDRRSIAINMVQPFGRVPLQLIGLTYYNFLYLSHGGVIMRDVMSNVIGYVQAAA